MTETTAAAEEEAADEVVRLANKWDPSEVKRVLDEFASQVILDTGYEEDMFLSNTKIWLGLLTCASALLAQLYPLPFPQNFTLLVVCCFVYFVLNSALQLFVYLREKDIILSTHPKPGAAPLPGLALSSALGKYSDEYTLTLQRSSGGGDGGSRGIMKPAELRKSVTAWFYEDGELAQDVFKADILKLLTTFERGRAKAD